MYNACCVSTASLTPAHTVETTEVRRMGSASWLTEALYTGNSDNVVVVVALQLDAQNFLSCQVCQTQPTTSQLLHIFIFSYKLNNINKCRLMPTTLNVTLEAAEMSACTTLCDYSRLLVIAARCFARAAYAIMWCVSVCDPSCSYILGF